MSTICPCTDHDHYIKIYVYGNMVYVLYNIL